MPMGDSVMNITLQVHRNPSSGHNDYKANDHFGNMGVDTWSPGFTHTDAAAMKTDAAVSQSAFDTTCAGVTGFGTWYSARSNTWKAAFRDMWNDLPS